MHIPKRRHVLVLLAAGLALSACGKSSPVQTTGSVGSSSATDHTSATADVTKFCSEVSGERPESYVGSPQHLADIAHALSIAPPEIRPQLQAYQSFLTSGGIDPNSPDSKLTSNWPPAVQTAVTEIQSYVTSNC